MCNRVFFNDSCSIEIYYSDRKGEGREGTPARGEHEGGNKRGAEREKRGRGKKRKRGRGRRERGKGKEERKRKGKRKERGKEKRKEGEE